MNSLNRLKVLVVASEVSPFIKSGGLGDVIGALPKELQRFGVDVRVACPKFKNVNLNKKSYLKTINVDLNNRNRICNIFVDKKNIITYFLANSYYFNREDLYGYKDDYERFAFFTKASVQMLKEINFIPDIIHFNDWQTGLGSLYLKDVFSNVKEYRKIKTVFTIHNVQYQGVFKRNVLNKIGLDDSYFKDSILKYYDSISMMKAGIVYSDFVTTVSKTYAKEIQTRKYGYGMNTTLFGVSYKLRGILNGLDKDFYNPENKDIHYSYNKNTIYIKKKNKTKLQKSLNLPRKDVPVISVVSRLADQKGIDLIQAVIKKLVKKDLQIIILGEGEAKYQKKLKYLERKYSEKLSVNINFDEELSKNIYAGSDIFLMPSLFEPCGLSQLIALRYGTIPIVRNTGGLSDTIYQYNPKTNKGNGFVFKNYKSKELLTSINNALYLYEHEEIWNKLIMNAMQSDFSWTASAIEYIKIYRLLKYMNYKNRHIMYK